MVALALIAGAVMPFSWLPLPLEARHLLRAGLAVAAGYVLTNALEHRLATARWSRDMRRAGLLRLIIRMLVYLVVVAAVLGALGVRLTQITFGGAVVTVIIGLAGQTLFANVLSGVVLVIWRPFDIGDDISVISWQMPLLPSTRPHETMPSANRLRVTDVNLLQTIGVADDGQMTLIPNAVLLQAIVRNHSHSGAQRLRVAAEAERDIDSVDLWGGLEGLGRDLAARSLPIRGEPQVRFLDITATGTAFVIELWVTEGRHLDQVRSEVLLAVAGILRALRAKPAADA